MQWFVVLCATRTSTEHATDHFHVRRVGTGLKAGRYFPKCLFRIAGRPAKSHIIKDTGSLHRWEATRR
jgi:hypothetical protein